MLTTCTVCWKVVDAEQHTPDECLDNQRRSIDTELSIAAKRRHAETTPEPSKPPRQVLHFMTIDERALVGLMTAVLLNMRPNEALNDWAIKDAVLTSFIILKSIERELKP